MAPLSCAAVTDLYGSNFGLTPEQIAKQTLKSNQECANNNNTYQTYLKENEIAGKANFNEKYTNDNNNIPPIIKEENNSKFAKRVSWTDKNNIWPSNQGFSMFNRFQNPFNMRENLEQPKTDSECLKQLVILVKELILIAKIIMLVLILLFIIKMVEKKN